MNDPVIVLLVKIAFIAKVVFTIWVAALWVLLLTDKLPYGGGAADW